ncbi:hypothetical protein J2S55_009761 [Streptosporangium brasiliense]|uniref:PD-(D/E)XK endonuclease-like domain-containing protein n=2 Tax=Streptosporangiaceae TaxID=2004 RepID=A0ABT9RMB3_9ACTN|nr:hypothetical protein [Streptosporangium brasiliense]
MGDIQAHLIKKADAPSDRRQDIIHPSEMAAHDWCPRATYYRIRDVRDGKPYAGEQFAVGTLSIFEEGHDIHRKWQGWLREMGVLEGRWDCLDCGRRGVDFGTDPLSCTKCDSVTGLTYGEVPLDAEKELLICGHADGKVGRRLIEIKSIGKGTVRMDEPELLKKHTHATVNGKNLVDLDGLWADLQRPLKPHVKQANVYLKIAQLMGIDVDEMVFLYEFKPNQQTKSFTIKISPRVIEPLLAKAESVADALHGGPVPPRAFDKSDKKPCSSCSWATECWKGSDADDSTQPQRGRRRRGEAAGAEGRASAGKPVRPRGTRRRATADPEGRNRPGRRRADAPVRRDVSVGELPQREALPSSGSRKVRRKRAGDPPSSGSPR